MNSTVVRVGRIAHPFSISVCVGKKEIFAQFVGCKKFLSLASLLCGQPIFRLGMQNVNCAKIVNWMGVTLL